MSTLSTRKPFWKIECFMLGFQYQVCLFSINSAEAYNISCRINRVYSRKYHFPGHCLFSRWVAVNKMVLHFWHRFLTQFALLFQMVPFFFYPWQLYEPPALSSLIGCWNCFNQSGYGWVFYHAQQNESHHLKEQQKTVSETGVKSDTPFCWGLCLRKTNSYIL